MGKNSPKVSIIIPCYNDGSFLSEAVKSVLDQQYKDIEIVIVDDGSKDEITKNLLAGLSKTPIIKVFYRNHGGVSEARNYAIKKAAGEYILPLDADDLLGESFLRKAVPMLDQKNDVKVVAGHEMMFGRRKGLKKFPEFSLEILMGQNLLPTTSLFRKVDFLKTSGFNPNMKASFEDWDFWLSLLETGGEVFHIDAIARYYRVRYNSRNFSLTKEDLIKLRRQIYENHKVLYANHFFDPLKSFEYDLLLNSREYKLGRRLLKPIRIFLGKLHRRAKAS